MIQANSTIVLRTQDAIYDPCKVLAINKESVKIQYCAGLKMDKSTGKMRVVSPIETIARKDVISISERL